MVLKHYSEKDQELGPIITANNIVTLQVSGESSTLDEFLNNLCRFWSIQPCSTIFWRTIDGKRPQKDEPAIAYLAMKVNSLSLMEEGNPDLGRKENTCSGQSA